MEQNISEHGGPGLGPVEYSDMFNGSALPQAVLDHECNLVMMNEAFCRFVGYKKERLLGMKFTDFKTKNLIKYINDNGGSVNDAIFRRQDTTGELSLETPSGFHVVTRSVHPVLDEGGNVKFVSLGYAEVTRLRKTQDYISQEIEEFIKVYLTMAQGDLTVGYRLEQPGDPDLEESFQFLSRLRESVRLIIGNLQVSIGDVNTRMDELARTVDVAGRDIDAASENVTRIANSTGVVSGNIQRVADSIGQISAAMQDMSAEVEEITHSVENETTPKRLRKKVRSLRKG
jgi:methyl-accepting chemotaxis protein